MKFSIVTPVFNGVRFLRETLLSVLNQEGDFEIEHIVVDGGSTDGTQQILNEFSEEISTGRLKARCRVYRFSWSVNLNPGMYAAINHGFTQATGDIYAWINGDDIYQPKAFLSVYRAFAAFQNVQWIKGCTSYIDENSCALSPGRAWLYHQPWIQKGIYGREAYFIQQDSVFWRGTLWKQVGGIPTSLRLAGDYWLWIEMSKHAPLWVINHPISSFRSVKGQLSQNSAGYLLEQVTICPTGDGFLDYTKAYFINFFFRLARHIPFYSSRALYRILFFTHRLPYIKVTSAGEMRLAYSKSFALNFSDS